MKTNNNFREQFAQLRIELYEAKQEALNFDDFVMPYQKAERIRELEQKLDNLIHDILAYIKR